MQQGFCLFFYPTAKFIDARERERGVWVFLFLSCSEPGREKGDLDRGRGMDPKLTEVSQVFERFKAAFTRSDLHTCNKLVSQLKVSSSINLTSQSHTRFIDRSIDRWIDLSSLPRFWISALLMRGGFLLGFVWSY